MQKLPCLVILGLLTFGSGAWAADDVHPGVNADYRATDAAFVQLPNSSKSLSSVEDVIWMYPPNGCAYTTCAFLQGRSCGAPYATTVCWDHYREWCGGCLCLEDYTWSCSHNGLPPE